MKQFESMLRHMISHIINENEKISEERICEAVSTRLMKEMDYIMREKEEVQDKQTALLQQILEEVKREIPETAASDEVKPTEARRKKKNEIRQKEENYLLSLFNSDIVILCYGYRITKQTKE